MHRYEVIEDNGGGLALVVFSQDNKVIYLHTGYEYNVGQLQQDLRSIQIGDNPVTDWDGNEDSPQTVYDNIISYPCGWSIIADCDGIYPEQMGSAGRLEFL